MSQIANEKLPIAMPSGVVCANNLRGTTRIQNITIFSSDLFGSNKCT